MTDHGTRRVVITGPRQVKVESLSLSSPGPDEVLVRVRASALCTFEQRAYLGQDTRFYPLLGGHEFAGLVQAVGDEVIEVNVGDMVAISAIERCGNCYSCRFGQACENVWFKKPEAERPRGPVGPGGLATHKLVKEYQVYKLPPDTDMLAGSLTEPLACVLRSIKKARVKPGDAVLILGGGVMGLLHTMLAAGRGAKVILSEPDAKRRETAEKFPVNEVLDPADASFSEDVRRHTQGRGADVVFVATSAMPALESAFGVVRTGGRILVYARMYPKEEAIAINPNQFHDQEIILTGTISHGREDFQQAAEMIGAGAIDLQPIISATYPLEKVGAAFEAAVDLSHYRVVVET